VTDPNVSPDEIDAAALQDARDGSDPGPSIHAAGRAYDWADGRHEEWDDDEVDPITGIPDWHDRYDTREEYDEGRL
jgi:hypothetical protein